jgi:hypothetical protein
MGYNILSGSVSSVKGFIGSGSFTGSFGGDGTDLENVKQFDLYGVQTSGRVVLFKEVSGKTALEADTNLFYDTTTDTLTTPNITASAVVNFSGLSAASASSEKYLALDGNNNVVLTSSSGGTGNVNITNDANNRITTANGSGGIVGEANLTFDGNFLSLQGGLVLKRRQITSPITASNTDYYIGISASANLDVRLPGAETLTNGQTFVIKDEAGNANSLLVTVSTSGSQTIDGSANIKLESPFAAINIYSDGASKYFIF